MANFRCERLFVMLEDPVPGLNHLKAVDPVEFAWLGSDDDAERLGLTPLGDFTFAPYERPKWQPAAKGLKTIRGLIDLYRGWLAQGSNPYGYTEEVLKKKLAVLSQVETVLDAADSRDRRFYLAAKDLS
ncbi:hypothetical protein [Paludisphaera rhizosphaerae]|uniref:hypothetical protein n=1 Tax=Paludisphaera rhizosphaerae TaxID=2711216 RepID=UPI0013ED3633|nr:hypothetical protein [Paludisphaera rhizosphaerae]